jgi:hypothetical protein
LNQESVYLQCECKRGWIGALCDTPEPFCNTNPCRNGGSCVPSINNSQDGTCFCPQPYRTLYGLIVVTGKNCESLVFFPDGKFSLIFCKFKSFCFHILLLLLLLLNRFLQYKELSKWRYL